MERPYFVKCDAVGTPPVEFFSLEKQKSRLVTASDNFTDAVRDLTAKAKFWLPIASEKLCISPDIKDYVLTPVISMPSDLPNKNIQAFPYRELTSWATDAGMVMYQSWRGKPAHTEHQNTDPTKAKGIIVDCVLKPIASTKNIWKVVKLIAWDRKKDPDLVNRILTKNDNSYSMGAAASDFSCSVCAALTSKGGCEHLKFGAPPAFNIYNGRLAYFNVVNPIGIECSHVSTPAFVSAQDMGRMSWLAD